MLEEEVRRARREERDVEDLTVEGECLAGADLSGLEFRRVRLHRCRFQNCDFSGAVFDRVEWSGCDFSNCRFGGTVWTDTVVRTAAGSPPAGGGAVPWARAPSAAPILHSRGGKSAAWRTASFAGPCWPRRMWPD